MSAEGGLRLGSWVVSAGVVLGATLLAGRVSGLLREMQLASSLGVSSQADAAVLLLTLPDLLLNLLLSGGLSAALIPRLKMLNLQDAQTLMRQTLIFALILFSLFAIIFSLTPTVFFSFLAPGLPTEAIPPTAAIFATAIAFPAAAAAGVTTAALNSQHKFLIPGFGTLIFNVVVIAALALGNQNIGQPLVLLGLGIAAGAILRLISQLINLPKGWLIGPIVQPRIDSQLIRGLIATAATASLMLLVPVIVRAFASTINPGAIASINYATKLVELPAGVLVTSLASVALVRLSSAYSKHDIEGARVVFQDGLKSAFLNAISSAILIGYFARPIVEVALGRGAMDAAAVERVVTLTQILMIGLPFLAVISMAIATLNAQEKPLVVLKITLICLLSLPILALPGAWTGSEFLLVFSIIIFQIIQAIMLIFKLDFKNSIWKSLKNKKLGLLVLIISLVLGAALAIDSILKIYSIKSNYVQLFLASGAMSIILLLQKKN